MVQLAVVTRSASPLIMALGRYPVRDFSKLRELTELHSYISKVSSLSLVSWFT